MILVETIMSRNYTCLIEIEDSLKPTIVSVSLNYSTGIIVISATETNDSTPRTLIDTTKILLYNGNVGDTLTILSENVSLMINYR